MKKILLILTSAVVVLSLPTQGKNKFGIGAMIGQPTGVSAAVNLGDKKRIDAAAGWKLGSDTNIYLHSTFLKLHPKAFRIADDYKPNIYYGVGARILEYDHDNKDDEFRLGARAPIGIHFELADPSIEFFGEIALILDIIEETDADLDIAIGARYWF